MKTHCGLALLIATLICGCSCDPNSISDGSDGGGDSGLPALARVDPDSLPVHPGSSWIRATGSGASALTELIVFEADNPATWSDELRRVTYARIDYEGNREILLGVMQPDGAGGTGEIVFSRRWVLALETHLPPLQREGAYEETVDPPTVEPLSLELNGNQLDVTVGIETKTYSNLIGMIGAIDSGVGFQTQAGAEAAAQLAQLPMLTSEARVEGFGSGGLLDFIGEKEAVEGLVDNGLAGDRLILSMAGLANLTMTLSYGNLQDQDGILVSGSQVREMNLSADGTASGTVAFKLRTDPASPMASVAGTLDFDGVTVSGGYLDGGSASMMLEGNPFTISTLTLIHLDFSAYLPVL